MLFQRTVDCDALEGSGCNPSSCHRLFLNIMGPAATSGVHGQRQVSYERSVLTQNVKVTAINHINDKVLVKLTKGKSLGPLTGSCHLYLVTQQHPVGKDVGTKHFDLSGIDLNCVNKRHYMNSVQMHLN